MIPYLIIVAATVLFLVLERVLPGRELPEAPGWYARAAFLNFCQVGIVLLAGVAWNRWLQSWSVFHISRSMPSFLQGLLGWFIGTFVFYWWHRARHDFNFLWRVCHQVHHSPARIELLTSFYKHPIEIAADSVLASALMFSLLGASPAAGALVQRIRSVGRILLPQQSAHPPLGWIHPATARASFHSSSTGCPWIQLWRHHLVGSPVRHLPGNRRLRFKVRLSQRA
jgi:sterol desaturase/sphingolipid hydroxylase (fatty acid hydroxylase superfamily)